MRNLIRAVIMRFAGAFFTLLLAIYLARHIGSHGSGIFYYALTLIVLLSQLVRLGLDGVVIRRSSVYSLKKDLYSLREFNGDVLLYTGLLGCAFVIVGFSVKYYFSFLLSDFLLNANLYDNVVYSIIPFTWLWVYASTLKGTGWASLSVFIEVGIVSLFCLVILPLWFNSEVNENVALTVQTIAIYLSCMLLLSFVWFTSGIVFRLDGIINRLQRLFMESLEGTWVVISNAIIVWMPLLLLGAIGAVSDVGIYNSAFRVTMIVGAFSSVFKSLVTPRLAVLLDDREKIPQLLRKYTTYVGLGLLLLMVIISFFLQYIFKLFGSEFESANQLGLIMLFGQFANVLVVMIETMFILDNRNSMLRSNTVFTVVLSIPLCWLLIEQFGLIGAAVSFAITNVLSRAGIVYLFNKSYGCRL